MRRGPVLLGGEWGCFCLLAPASLRRWTGRIRSTEVPSVATSRNTGKGGRVLPPPPHEIPLTGSYFFCRTLKSLVASSTGIDFMSGPKTGVPFPPNYIRHSQD